MPELPQTVDYIVVGGGTAGNVVAARLAERGFSVLVVEAGKDESAEPEIRIPGLFVKNSMNEERNWNIKSTPQSHVNGRQIPLPRSEAIYLVFEKPKLNISVDFSGKSLGGTSNVNYMQLNYPAAREFNEGSIQSLGIEGWSWDDLLPYFKKFEKINTDTTIDAHIQPQPNVHGDSGPVEATLPVETTPSRELWFKTMNEIGVKTNPDVKSGSNLGVWNCFQAIDSKNRARVSSDTAYIKPALSKLPNLHVATEAHVSRVLLSAPGDGSLPVAEGVEFIQGGEKRTVKALKEVVVSAGTYGTPQVLELSGIGDKNVLSKHDFTRDENQRLTYIILDVQRTIHWRPLPSSYHLAWIPSTHYETIQPRLRGKCKDKRRGKFAIIPLSFATLPANRILSAEAKAALKDGLRQAAKNADNALVPKMVELQLGWLDSDEVAFLEYIESSAFMPSNTTTPEPGKCYFTVACCLQFPLSRGTVHIASTDPMEKPLVDPQFLSAKTDLDIIVAGFKFIQGLFTQSKTFAEGVVGEVAPATGGDDEKLREYIKNNLNVVFHPVGTAAMLPRELGGVVDKDLKVYGVDGLRVADASIFPIEFSTHPMATVYAMAEKAADIIGGSSA
ncbi:hypothetical protein PQX77_007584 [Marasmius sp. AFHP31]|nr:hypothetical protein PQX77_007584 [Marasmius sp. AFHP31]